jgi:diacylglycerol kinase family enzyme
MGTMNNLARSLGIPLNLDDACALLRMGFTRHIDVGRIRTTDKPKGVYFLEMAGIGLSAHALPLSQDAKKGRWGKLLSSMGNAFAAHIGTLTISYDDETEFQAHTHVVTIANAPLFGENMFIGPDTKMDDGVLDVALYRDMSKFDLEQHFMAIATGKRVDDPRISFRHVRRIRVSANEPIVANADLAILAPQPTWEIAVVPCALAVIAGNGIGLTLPVESAVVVPPLAGPQPLLIASNGHAQPLNGEIAPLIG